MGGQRARRIGRSAPDERPPPLPAAAARTHGYLLDGSSLAALATRYCNRRATRALD